MIGKSDAKKSYTKDYITATAREFRLVYGLSIQHKQEKRCHDANRLTDSNGTPW